MSPTTISATGIWITCPPRTTVNFCSCSMRLWRPLNCFSLLQSLNAVTNTTQITDRRMAAPSIQPASDSFSSSTPPAALPQSAETGNTKTLPHMVNYHICPPEITATFHHSVNTKWEKFRGTIKKKKKEQEVELSWHLFNTIAVVLFRYHPKTVKHNNSTIKKKTL